MPPDPTDINTSLISPLNPYVIVLFGATGDLSRRKLLPGLFHLVQAGLVPECRIVGTSLDELDDEGFRAFARSSLDEFARHGVAEHEWVAFSRCLSFVSLSTLSEYENTNSLTSTVRENNSTSNLLVSVTAVNT